LAPSGQAQLWLDKANEDEQVVALIIANQGPWTMAAYHLQQACEKYIKALLVDAGIAPPRTHDIPALLVLLPHSVPQDVIDAATDLAIFAWATRYPGAAPVSGAAITQGQVNLDLIKAWIYATF